METDPPRQENPFLKGEEVSQSPSGPSNKEGSESVEELLEKLKKAVKEERVSLLLQRFDAEWRVFKDKLGEDECREAFNEFMREKLDGKVIAAQK